MSRKLVNFDIVNGNLQITLNTNGRTELNDLIEDKGLDYLNTDQCFSDLIEWQIGNGWEYIQPEEVGALTSGTILTRDCKRDDHGKLLECGRVFWDSNYAVRSAVKDLLENGVTIFVGRE